jgi:hypothetical protein
MMRRALGLLALFAVRNLCAQDTAPATQPPVDPVALAAKVQQDVEAIRGLPFKHPIPLAKQSPEDFGRYLDREMTEAVPEAVSEHFGKIVRRLGLYRGPEIQDFRGMMRTVMTSQAAAYYDPETKRIYILSGTGNEIELGVIYAHELYHGMQDQYFDLNAYLPTKTKLDGDHALARQAVVEGEATYIHTLWVIRRMTNGMPPRALIAPAIRMQADLTIDQMRSMVGDSAKEAMAEIDNIPPFILETLLGNYLKGAAFVFAVQEQGWPAVEKLYKEYPPQSTEQILHPEKWLAREGPATITWPDFRKVPALKDWELIDDDVLGEIQWRIIFNVQGQQATSEAAAAGWDADRYAVFKRKGSDETLLLLRTSWDSEAEATQFADTYRRALTVKYEGASDPVRVEQQGAEVFIVEGGRKADLDALIQVVRQAKKTRS